VAGTGQARKLYVLPHGILGGFRQMQLLFPFDHLVTQLNVKLDRMTAELGLQIGSTGALLAEVTCTFLARS